MIKIETITPIIFEWYCWLIKITVAIIHKTNPAIGIILLLFVCFENLKPTKLTIPKMSKNPTLPAVEMLSKLRIFTKINVAIAVINNPIGWFQSFARKWCGSSSSSAIS